MKRYIKATVVPIKTLNDWIRENKDTGPSYKYVWVLDENEDSEFVVSDGSYQNLCAGSKLSDNALIKYEKYSNLTDFYNDYEIMEEVRYPDGGVALVVSYIR